MSMRADAIMIDAYYPLNTRVTVYITRAIPSGLLGKVGDRRAIIRKREISWDGSDPDRYIGQTRQAIVIGYNPVYDELELSLRLVEHDPWQEAAAKYRVGTIVQGQVRGLIKDAAFVEVEKGIEGYLPLSELLPQPVERIEEVLWIGDHVKAMVLDIDPTFRRMHLSTKELLIRRETEYRKDLWSRYQDATSSTTIAAALPQEIRLQLLYKLQESTPAAESVADLDILVVEDDPIFGPGLASLLKRNGCRVVLAPDAMSALREVHTRAYPFDAILIDWGLPDIKGHELVHLLQKERVASRLVMILEPAPLQSRPDVWHDLQETGIDILLKSDEGHCQASLVAILSELRGSASTTRHAPQGVPTVASSMAEQTADSQHMPLPIQPEGIYGILERLQKDTRATTVTLVLLDTSGQLKTVAQVGDPFLLDEAPPDVIHSPLGDVLQANQEVYEAEVRLSRFERLLALASFQSFIGIPLPTVDARRHGLVLLKQRGSFSNRDRELARLAAYMAARTLTGTLLLKALQPWQAQSLAGQMIASAIHEITNKLFATKLHLDELQKLVEAMWHQPQKANDPVVLQQMEEKLAAIAEAWKSADLLRRQYLSPTSYAESDDTLVNIEELITGIVQLLRAEAQSHGIILDTDLAKGLPPIKAVASPIRQILWNLILNAIQQMAQVKRQGRITIRTAYVSTSPRPIHVSVSDEGPGIHTQLWERIFDFGFSTRKGGAGLGLTICRQMASSLGGLLRLAESYVLWGTTFVVELPLEARADA